LGPIARLLNLRDDEAGPTLLAALSFFLVLCGYFMLRPLRDAMGVQRGMDDLRWLFFCTLLVMIPANVLFGWVATRFVRRLLVPAVFRFVTICLVVFAGLLHFAPQAVGLWTGYVFYVWLSVANLFLTSLFWVTLADGFTLERSKRLFPVIAVGGTLGALGGGAFNAHYARSFAPVWFFVLAIVLLEGAVWALGALRRAYEARGWRGEPRRAPLGGSPLRGMARVVRSPYLLGIGGYIFLLAVANTLLYFATRQIVVGTTVSDEERQRLFGLIDTWAQSLTLLTQLFVTGRLLRRLGVGFVLTLLPAVTVAGFAALAVAPVFLVGALFEASFRAGKYALARPARETLFTVVDDADRLQAKPFIDTFVYRGGDAAGVIVDAQAAAWARALSGLGGAAVLPVAGIATLLSVFWAALGVALGRAQRRRATMEGNPRNPRSPGPGG